jgi:lipopolysaccharide/colanic/teichoic acid biosynthesis glycosyltransferase
VGTFQEYMQVHHDILGGAYSAMRVPARQVSPGVWQGHHTSVHPEARLIPPVLLGNHCRVGREAVVGPNTVLGEHAIVAEGAHVTGSVVSTQTYVGRMIHLEECLAYDKWLVKLRSGAGVFVSDDTFLSGPSSALMGRAVSRAVDMTLGGLGLLGAMPVFLAVGVGNRLARQRVIERQWHLAPDLDALEKGGTPRMRPFQLLRFSPKGAMGKLAERLGVARLPALYNVVRGDISLVVTKPLTAEEAAQVPEEWQAHLCRAPAGFTGLWRVQGNSLSLDEILAVDAFYAASRSLRGDLGILWRSATGKNR